MFPLNLLLGLNKWKNSGSGDLFSKEWLPKERRQNHFNSSFKVDADILTNLSSWYSSAGAASATKKEIVKTKRIDDRV